MVTGTGYTRYGERHSWGMGGIKLLTALYTIMFVLLVVIAIASILGVFDNPLIDPGL